MRALHEHRDTVRRIDQWLANLGYCSRQQARAWVKDGRVTVDEKRVHDSGQKVAAEKMRVDGAPLDHPEGLLLLLHKSPGLVCSHDPNEGPSIYSLLPERWQKRNPLLTSVGRLDKDTSGALVLTDRSEWVHRWTSPKHKVPKVYIADVDRELPDSLVACFAEGTLILPGESEPCSPAVLRLLAPTRAELTLTEGRYHQVRRMFGSQGFEVIALHRLRFGKLEVADLRPGTWRALPLDPAVVEG